MNKNYYLFAINIWRNNSLYKKLKPRIQVSQNFIYLFFPTLIQKLDFNGDIVLNTPVKYQYYHVLDLGSEYIGNNNNLNRLDVINIKNGEIVKIIDFPWIDNIIQKPKMWIESIFKYRNSICCTLWNQTNIPLFYKYNHYECGLIWDTDQNKALKKRLTKPTGWHYYKNNYYIFEPPKRRILKLNPQLQLINTLSAKPGWSDKVYFLDNIVCIVDSNSNEQEIINLD
jgi:hypothetical protein